MSLGQEEEHVPGNWRKADAGLCASGLGQSAQGSLCVSVSKYEGSDVTVPRARLHGGSCRLSREGGGSGQLQAGVTGYETQADCRTP